MGLSEKDSELASQARNFATVLASDPQRYGQSVDMAAAVTAAVGTFLDSYHALMQARAAGVRSEQMTATRDADRQAMLNLLRPIYMAVQASAIDDADKVALGVHVKKTTHTPSPVPAMAPSVTVTRVDGSVVSIRVRNPETPYSSARPAQTEGIAVFYHVGDEPPVDRSGLKFVRNSGSGKIDVSFGPTVTLGTTVWISAAFFNGRKQMGPASSPVRATIGSGSTMPALKLAA